MNDFPSFSDHLLVWVFGILLPFFSAMQSQRFAGTIQLDAPSRKKLYLSNSLMLAVSGTAIVGIWLSKERALSGLGFALPRIENQLFFLAVMAFFLAVYLSDLFIGISKAKKKLEQPTWYEQTSFLPESTREIPAYLILCLAAGFFEEIIYRGFMITYFMPVAGEPDSAFPWLALLAPGALFGMAHFYQGWAAVLKIFFFSLLLGFIFIYTGSLYPTMIIHFLIDLVSGLTVMHIKKSKHEN